MRQVAAKCCLFPWNKIRKLKKFVQILLEEFIILFAVFDSGRQMVSRGRGQLRSYAFALP